MNNSNYPQIRRNGLVVQEMPDEVLVYDLNTNKAHCLNESAATVFHACDGTNSISDIVLSFERNGNKVTEDFVWLAIDGLNENGLLEAGTASRFAGQSRRDVLKKIGFASVIAIPVIASLVAPRNALASNSCTCAALTPSGNTFCATLSPPSCPKNSCGGGGVCI